MNADKQQIQFHFDMPFEEALQRFSNVNTRDLQEIPQDNDKPSPFVKWAGGKRGIINELIQRLPKKFNTYYEPFVGGGALFFAIYDNIQQAFLSDKNLDLIITYNVIKRDYETLIQQLEEHKKKHNKDYYYKVRKNHYPQDPIDIASRFIYLNKTCYNGLWRTNSKGEFNVPIGRYKDPNIVQKDNLKACNEALQCAIIEYHDFEDVMPKKNDFVYIDPPYHPTDDKSFTKYTKLDFSEKDQIRLHDYIIELYKNGVKVMISNSKTEFIDDLFSEKFFNKEIIDAPRFVNCKSDKRKPVKEFIITTY